jgi:hypothetical protein
MKRFAEPKITINGVELTEAQALTVRVAISGWDWDCGEDEVGKAMSKAYRARAREILKIMLPRKPS